jgi:uncharacterized membrane protein
VGDKLTRQHKFAIATKIYDYETYSPGDQYENYLKIVNVGNLKEKGIQIKVIVPDLDVEEILTSSFNLDPYQTRWVEVKFNIPKDTTKNEYLAKITLDGKKSDAFGYLTFSVD